ncbi:MAG: hypothetical protein FWD86_04090, partial [Firmicutes bacterium]|nr:hypothetical protein [Bacillota bacterium]
MAQKNNKNQDQGRGKQGKQFEIVAVILILTSFFFLICLSIPNLFSVVGRAIHSFWTGVFGIFSYALFTSTILTGALVLRRQKIHLQKRKIVYISLLSFFGLSLLQLATTHSLLSLSFGQHMSAVYDFSDNFSIGGVFFSLFNMLFVSTIGIAGAYIAVSILFLLFSALLTRDILKDRQVLHDKRNNRGVGHDSRSIKQADFGIIVETEDIGQKRDNFYNGKILVPSKKPFEQTDGRFNDLEESGKTFATKGAKRTEAEVDDFFVSMSRPQKSTEGLYADKEKIEVAARQEALDRMGLKIYAKDLHQSSETVAAGGSANDNTAFLSKNAQSNTQFSQSDLNTLTALRGLTASKNNFFSQGTQAKQSLQQDYTQDQKNQASEQAGQSNQSSSVLPKPFPPAYFHTSNNSNPIYDGQKESEYLKSLTQTLDYTTQSPGAAATDNGGGGHAVLKTPPDMSTHMSTQKGGFDYSKMIKAPIINTDDSHVCAEVSKPNTDKEIEEINAKTNDFLSGRFHNLPENPVAEREPSPIIDSSNYNGKDIYGYDNHRIYGKIYSKDNDGVLDLSSQKNTLKHDAVLVDLSEGAGETCDELSARGDSAKKMPIVVDIDIDSDDLQQVGGQQNKSIIEIDVDHSAFLPNQFTQAGLAGQHNKMTNLFKSLNGQAVSNSNTNIQKSDNIPLQSVLSEAKYPTDTTIISLKPIQTQIDFSPTDNNIINNNNINPLGDSYTKTDAKAGDDDFELLPQDDSFYNKDEMADKAKIGDDDDFDASQDQYLDVGDDSDQDY